MAGMRGTRSHGAATLRLSYSQALPAPMRGGVREITGLYVPPKQRGTGLGSALLEQVCREADQSRLVLLLQPKPFDAGLSETELLAWYARHGFTVLQDQPLLMARPAHG